MSVTVVGSIALDSIETYRGKKNNILGGTAIHFSNAASLLSKVNLIGVVGSDFSMEGFEFLSNKNVDTQGLEIIKNGKTFSWIGKYEKNMNKAITLETNLNVFEFFKPKIPESYKQSDFLFLGNISPILQNQVYEEINVKKASILDSMNFWINSKKVELERIMRKVDIVLINDQELKDFVGIDNLINAGKELLKIGLKHVIIKKGEHGVSLFSKNQQYINFPAYPVENFYDPTGAGDSFAGAFISYLDRVGIINWINLKAALIYAIIVSSFCVENFGIQGLNYVTHENIMNRYKLYNNYSSIVKISSFN